MPSGAWELKVFLWILALCLFGFAITCHAQDLSGFISTDCGLIEGSGYRDDATGIPYSTDADFIDAGENHMISRDYINNDSLERQLWRVRSFPYGRRNCYNLSAGARELKGNKYLIRATFMYGNYDSKNQTPIFDLHLGVEFWTTVEPKSSISVVREEIIHVPSSNYLSVCLVNTDSGTPFISALELRPLNKTIYPTDNESLAKLLRKNFAPETDQIIRHPNDKFDRLWEPHQMPLDWAGLSTTETIENEANNNYHLPPNVMRTAATPRNASLPFEFNWSLRNPTEQFYVFFHFAEVQRLSSGESRHFYIYLKDELWYKQILTPEYLISNTIFARSGNSEASFDYSFMKTDNSTLPPSVNAVEVYMVKRFLQSQTDEDDVFAMVNIKSVYGVKRSNWQGDPCLPEDHRWEGLDCDVSDNQTIPPRIKFLNLSSSGLTGNVSFYLSNLTSLEYLDLSNNNLTGVVPDFLAELPSLKVLNLTGNKFSWSIPQKLVDKKKHGLLLRIEDLEREIPNHCQSGDGSECKKNKTNPKSLIASLIIMASLIVLWRIRWGSREDVPEVESESNGNNRFLELKRLRLSYSRILEITDNFERVLGKGGFGTVYHGVHAGNQVAVKLLSPSSVQGYNEFQTEAELLTRVHHRNLTTLVGYCYEDNKMALVYEYMANGNLRKVLSDNHGDVLSWLGRLQIALDAAQGLDYLHNGCKPQIIHRDIKSTNILLNEKLEAKLADFGLSRAFSTEDDSFVSTRVMGTLGYIDPEYCESQKLHEKSDIYSLGIVILELITGRSVVFKGNQDQQRIHITQWVNHLVVTADIETIVDPKLNGDYDTNSAWKALEVAMACSSSSSLRRPAMAHVIKELNECLAAERARREGSATYSEDTVQVDLVSLEIEPRPR